LNIFGLKRGEGLNIMRNDPKKLLEKFTETLNKYERILKENPNSLFAKGMVKNTKDLINNLSR